MKKPLLDNFLFYSATLNPVPPVHGVFHYTTSVAMLSCRRDICHQHRHTSTSLHRTVVLNIGQDATLGFNHKVGHHVESLHCHICLKWSLLVFSWYHDEPETHQLNLNKVCDSLTSGPKDQTPGYLGPIKSVK